MFNTINPQIEYINDDSPYVVSSTCSKCKQKNTKACNDCAKKRTEPSQKSECNSCSQKKQQSNCNCEKTKTEKRTVCQSNHFSVQNYFSELVHAWEKDLARYNLGIQELENINYITEETPEGEFLNKVQFVFRKGHELITKEFLVSPKGRDGKDGKNFTWDDLTESQRLMLKGDQGEKGNDGETPILNSINVSYTESTCEVGGRFERLGNSNLYNLFLVLPKQRTFDECLEEIRNLIAQFNLNYDNQFDLLKARIDGIETFDFNKLGLHLSSDGKTIKPMYKGITNNNSITLNIPKESPYDLKAEERYVYCNDEKIGTKHQNLKLISDYITLTNGENRSDILLNNYYLPLDWWILTEPCAVYFEDDTPKPIRVSAWFSGVDRTTAPTSEDKNTSYKYGKDFSFSIQCTSGQVWDAKEQIFKSHYINVTAECYNPDTGELVLPPHEKVFKAREFWNCDSKNGMSEDDRFDNTFETPCRFSYKRGDFLNVLLYHPNYGHKRLIVPVLYGENRNESFVNTSSNNNTTVQTIPTYVNINPDIIADDVTQVTLHYTADYSFVPIKTYYNSDNQKITDNTIICKKGVITYKNTNGKRQLIGNISSKNVTIVSPEDTDVFNLKDIRVDTIQHVNSDSSQFVVHFVYSNNGKTQELSEDQYVAIYNQLEKSDAGAIGYLKNEMLKMRVNSSTTELKDLTLLKRSHDYKVGDFYYSYKDLQLVRQGGTRGYSQNIANYLLLAKGTDGYKGSKISVVNSTVNLNDVDTLKNAINSFIMQNSQYEADNMIFWTTLSTTTKAEVEESNVSQGYTVANGLIFKDGLFVTTTTLEGDVQFAESGDYAYVESDDTLKVQNLTKKDLLIKYNDKEINVAAQSVATAELKEATKGDPVD